MTPVRSCIVCRKKEDKHNFIRIVRNVQGKVLLDPEQKMNGRGAYICRNPECITQAGSRDLVSSHLNVEVNKAVYQELINLVRKKEKPKMGPLLGFAARARKVAFGITAVEQGVKKGKIDLIIVDRSLQNHSRKRLAMLAEKNFVKIVEINDEKPLAQWIGKVNCRCAGIKDRHFASRDAYRRSDL